MNIGEFKHKITIQRKINNNNPLTDANFEVFKTVWAKVNNLFGKEFIEAQKVNPNISKKIIIRYIKDLDMSFNPNTCKDYKVSYKGISYNILYIDNIKEQNKFIELILEVE